MKKYLSLFILFVAGCAPLSYIPAETSVYSFNLSAFVDKGFNFFENCYGGKYILLSDIALVYYAEGRNDSGSSVSKGSWKFMPINTDKILDLVYKEANKYGANAVMDFEFEVISRQVKHQGRIIDVPGLRVTGKAIFVQE